MKLFKLIEAYTVKTGYHNLHDWLADVEKEGYKVVRHANQYLAWLGNEQMAAFLLTDEEAGYGYVDFYKSDLV